MDSDTESVYDLGLSISDKTLLEFEDGIEMLQKGDQILFEAEIIGLGLYDKLHHLHAWSVKKVPGHLDF